jgi:hypothetical protein
LLCNRRRSGATVDRHLPLRHRLESNQVHSAIGWSPIKSYMARPSHRTRIEEVERVRAAPVANPTHNISNVEGQDQVNIGDGVFVDRDPWRSRIVSVSWGR